MFKYVKFTKIQDGKDTISIVENKEDVTIHRFSVNAASIEAQNEDDIDDTISTQDDRTDCVEISQDEFKTLVQNTSQLKRIREVVAVEVAKRYTVADEIALGRLADDDVKRTDYENYVAGCIAIGRELKNEIGY